MSPQKVLKVLLSLVEKHGHTSTSAEATQQTEWHLISRQISLWSLFIGVSDNSKQLKKGRLYAEFYQSKDLWKANLLNLKHSKFFNVRFGIQFSNLNHLKLITLQKEKTRKT